jgi:hypothetical protein
MSEPTSGQKLKIRKGCYKLVDPEGKRHFILRLLKFFEDQKKNFDPPYCVWTPYRIMLNSSFKDMEAGKIMWGPLEGWTVIRGHREVPVHLREEALRLSRRFNITDDDLPSLSPGPVDDSMTAERNRRVTMGLMSALMESNCARVVMMDSAGRAVKTIEKTRDGYRISNYEYT